MERKIYLKQKEIKLGVGSTARTTTIENYYEVVEVDHHHLEIQLLDLNDKPFGKPEIIEKEELKDYIYCPDYFNAKKDFKESTIEKHVESGNKHFEKREFYRAETEYNKALSLNKEHLRANLGKGKTLYARGEKQEARKIFSKLATLEDLFERQNKPIFNDFMAELRKKKMFEEAISNYLKAISLDPTDEVLFYNLGSAYYEAGDREKAVEHLRSALTLKPDFKEAQKSLETVLPHS